MAHRLQVCEPLPLVCQVQLLLLNLGASHAKPLPDHVEPVMFRAVVRRRLVQQSWGVLSGRAGQQRPRSARRQGERVRNVQRSSNLWRPRPQPRLSTSW
eukprot:2883967-Prymnesium_polylepis.2